MKLALDPRRLLARLRGRDPGGEGGEGEASARSAREPVVRRMNFDFSPPDAPLPRHWMNGSVLGTNLSNGINLLFPDGERFFIRSVRHHLDQIDDPELLERARRFFGQEGQHAHEHQRMFEALREQGVDVDAFLTPYRRIAYELLEPRVPAKLCLSITAALEHFTATFAEGALRDRFFTEVPEAVAELLLWHAAEEIEHKDVAFDVLERVDDSYALRVAGLVAATALLSGFWAMATIILLRQDPEADAARLFAEWRRIGETKERSSSQMAGAFLSYLRPDFHPSQIPNDELARAYLEEIGRAAG